jgi:hypothetical protein
VLPLPQQRHEKLLPLRQQNRVAGVAAGAGTPYPCDRDECSTGMSTPRGVALSVVRRHWRHASASAAVVTALFVAAIIRLICFNPSPATTQGEAEFVRRLARQHRWESLALVAVAAQATRARLRVSRCFPGQTYMVTAPLPQLSGPTTSHTNGEQRSRYCFSSAVADRPCRGGPSQAHLSGKVWPNASTSWPGWTSFFWRAGDGSGPVGCRRGPMKGHAVPLGTLS